MNEELVKLLEGMDIPPMRKNDAGWLWRNLAVKNQFKPGFTRAMELIKKEIVKDWKKEII